MGYKTETHRHRQQYGGYQREVGAVKDKGGHIFGDRRFDFGLWGNNAIYRSHMKELYI